MRHKIFLIIFSVMGILATTMNAKSLQEIWESRPSRLLNGLEKKADFKIGTTTCDYMSITLTKVSDIQIKRLPSETNDSIMCVIHTYYGPVKESTITFFTQEWKNIGKFPMPSSDFFRQEPDSAEDSTASDSLKIDTYLLSAKLSPQDNSLTMNIGFPNNTPKEADVTSMRYKSKTLIWNGKTFK